MASLISALCDMSFRSASSTISAFASAGSRTSIDVHSIPPRCAITPGYISISARANIGARQDSRDKARRLRRALPLQALDCGQIPWPRGIPNRTSRRRRLNSASEPARRGGLPVLDLGDRGLVLAPASYSRPLRHRSAGLLVLSLIHI